MKTAWSFLEEKVGGTSPTVVTTGQLIRCTNVVAIPGLPRGGRTKILNIVSLIINFAMTAGLSK
jgi:hypothetical protein